MIEMPYDKQASSQASHTLLLRLAGTLQTRQILQKRYCVGIVVMVLQALVAAGIAAAGGCIHVSAVKPHAFQRPKSPGETPPRSLWKIDHPEKVVS